jgi:zinc transport system substrate-binding protein
MCILLSLSAGLSASPRKEPADNGKPTVVTTLFPPYDFVRQIAGESVNLTMLLPPGAESHSFEPTPQDIIKIQNSSLFIYAGGESDAWVDRILSTLDTSRIRVLRLMDCVEIVEEEIVEGMQDDEHDHEDEDHDHEGEEEDHDHEGEEEDHDHEEEAEYDEHVWTSPRNAKLIVERISGELCEIDRAKAGEFRAKTGDYLAKLDALDAAFRNAVNQGRRRIFIFGDRFPFRYFADAYGLRYFAAFPGCSTETEASAATVAFLIDKVRAEQIPVVFHIELSNEKIADTICEATGAKKALFHAAHNVSRQEFTGGASYLELMTKNVEALKEALR